MDTRVRGHDSVGGDKPAAEMDTRVRGNDRLGHNRVGDDRAGRDRAGDVMPDLIGHPCLLVFLTVGNRHGFEGGEAEQRLKAFFAPVAR